MRKKPLRGSPLFVTLFMLLCCTLAAAEALPQVTVESVEVGESRVEYPQLNGLGNDAIQQAINDDIIIQGDIASHLVTLSSLREGSVGLVVTCETFLKNDILSVSVHAKGPMAGGRMGQSNQAMCYDLKTGGQITPQQIFTDVEAAQADMEQALMDTMLDELSAHLENAGITPIPMNDFALDEVGITFYYPSSQFSFLSGYGGACHFFYEELSEHIAEDGILARIEGIPASYSDEESKALVVAAVEAGKLPFLPLSIGDAMTDVIMDYRLLRQPDQFPGGRYYQLEAPQFRQMQVISDALESGYENSKVQGVQAMRGSLYGLTIGQTTQSRWREVLGQPDETVVFSESLAYDYGLVPGESDFYTFGDYQLRLHRDGEGILYSIRLGQ